MTLAQVNDSIELRDGSTDKIVRVTGSFAMTANGRRLNRIVVFNYLRPGRTVLMEQFTRKTFNYIRNELHISSDNRGGDRHGHSHAPPCIHNGGHVDNGSKIEKENRQDR